MKVGDPFKSVQISLLKQNTATPPVSLPANTCGLVMCFESRCLGEGQGGGGVDDYERM